MNYDVQELRSKISSYGRWEKEMKETLFNQMVYKLKNEAKVGIKSGKEELVLSVRPKGFLVCHIVAVKVGLCRGFDTILYRTENKDYDIPTGNYCSSQTEIRPNGMVLSGYVDLYEAILKTLEDEGCKS